MLAVVHLSDRASLRGKLTRTRGSSTKTVAAFLGVPYAAPPVNELRFQPPRAAALWEGERDATQYGQCTIYQYQHEGRISYNIMCIV